MKHSMPEAWLRLVCLIAILLVAGTVVQARPGRALGRKPWKGQARRQTVQRLAQRSRDQREHALQRAIREGWYIGGRQGATYLELVAIRHNLPRVFKTRNLEAAISVGIPAVLEDESDDLLGAGQVVGVWDSGNIRSSHQELDGRVELMEPLSGHYRPWHGRRHYLSYSDHATHIAGTIGAAGIDSQALGMAPEVEILSYNYNDDLSEVAQAAMSDPNEAESISISNHSYGYVCGWDYSDSIPSWYGIVGEQQSYLFGLYDEESAQWDDICYQAPYYLPFRAAGNDRADTAPDEGNLYEVYVEDEWGGWRWRQIRYSRSDGPGDDGVDGGYDSLPPDCTSKNIVTVGAVQKAVRNGMRDVNEAAMTYFSSWGPTNDGRVKPDLVACGIDLYSCVADSNNSYDTYSGTSMAVAVATGGAALLTELYQRYEPNSALLSSTLKGLMIHTADDLGNPGPDYQNGWGLVDINEAVGFLNQAMSDANQALLIEAALDANTPEAEWTLWLAAGEGLKATLCWTDPPAPVTEDTDNNASCLVNDLDLRVTDPNGRVYRPFILDPNQPALTATTGDNSCDNVEQILVKNIELTGMVAVSITCKGHLQGDRQGFSLLMSRP